MAQLALSHRRKLKSDTLEQACSVGGDSLVYLCLLLRLAVLTHHSRSEYIPPIMNIEVINSNEWQITVTNDNEHYTSLLTDLQAETEQFSKWGIKLSIVEA